MAYNEGGDYQVFGDLPFDQFIVSHWDHTSSQTKVQQKRDLVRAFVLLGVLGRKENLEHFWDRSDQSPPEIPRDLLSPSDREIGGRWLWIRTWYGREEGDKESAEQADKDFAHLMDRVFNDESLDNFHGVMFNSKEEFASEQSYTPGSTPDWLLSALCHCPDIFDGSPSAVAWDAWESGGGEEFWDTLQNVLVFVADEKACTKGNVLIFGINHKCQILLPLIRAPACKAMEMANSWIGNGESLQELGDFNGEECYLYDGKISPEQGWSPA